MAKARPATKKDLEELFSTLVKVIGKKIDKMADKKLEPYLIEIEIKKCLLEIKTELEEMKKLLITVSDAKTQYDYFKQKEKREIN